MHKQHNKILDIEFYCTYNTDSAAEDHCAIVQFIVSVGCIQVYYCSTTVNIIHLGRWRLQKKIQVAINDVASLSPLLFSLLCL